MKSLKNKIKTINNRKIVKIEILAFIIALLTLIVTRYTDILKKPVITFSNAPITLLKNNEPKIGRASCRERVSGHGC